MSPDDLDKIELQDAINMWELYQKGMVGPTKDYYIQYQNFCMMYQHMQISAHAKNKKKPDTFARVFPEVNSIIRLQPETKPKTLAEQGDNLFESLMRFNAST